MKKWYLIKTKPKQEKIAIDNLENQNYHVYCPCAKINKKIVVLFPGYLFIYLDETSESWSPIRSTKGVLNFVRFGLSHAQISNKIIDYIKDNEVNTINKIKKINDYKLGDKVQITEGIFNNCVAIFQSLKPDERVMLLINLMGQQQSIKIKKKSLIRL
ncbi:transcription/translation regulatory transformer protein RfaH [Candidatus Pseudothioglobus singularis]|nr:transcription/translation regulatory transformer protein RfaH [Candidatus Pseudothioglobus singularis]